MVNKINDGALFRMHSRQIGLFRNDVDDDYAFEQIDSLDLPDQYKEMFKMCCNLQFVEAAGSALVHVGHEEKNQ